MIERIRVVQPVRETVERREPRYCDVHGCPLPTKDHKAFCRLHVTQTPYARAILKELKKQEAKNKRQQHSKT
jgi:hypothetical protein